uniref:Uncharacterized protein n=1 Tax=Chromera velia CCMP2878 TaxID=1169474 RepID=A0A0G4FGB6_9ALVE|eukprot:Cvel_16843.t1-p1 / transcript=Cvel_16843.t1 / gene=Cvel_16843 / organism=Chromera_velia_CCMP2878 / gene_product=Glutaredoxin-C4, putative / transcript_product=Glutaredoxin-C4, putative / location=Cvel_scaffold1317:11685-14474(-) / protein_length=586 / sequence_SO=supercontig / SO=protein_coding / is_pseudo=false
MNGGWRSGRRDVSLSHFLWPFFLVGGVCAVISHLKRSDPPAPFSFVSSLSGGTGWGRPRAKESASSSGRSHGLRVRTETSPPSLKFKLPSLRRASAVFASEVSGAERGESGTAPFELSTSGAHRIAETLVIFSRVGCKYCKRAKQLLRRLHLPFTTVDVEGEPGRLEEAKDLIVRAAGQERPSSLTLPQIFFNGRYIGGYDDLVVFSDSGALREAVHSTLQEPAGKLVTVRGTPPGRVGSLPVWDDALEAQVDKLRHLKSMKAPYPLNGGIEPTGIPREAGSIAESLRRSMSRLDEEFVSPEDGLVDYHRMRTSDQWYRFLALATDLQQVKGLNSLPEEERKAFFINLYNCVTFHGVTEFGSPGTSLWQKYKFFKSGQVAYNVGGVVLTNDDIENGILRDGPTFFQSEGDPRSSLKVPLDPRIHFALNCGSMGCPPVSVYRGDRLEEELSSSTAAFLSSPKNFRIEEGEGAPASSGEERRGPTVWVSQLFEWYMGDFVGRETVASEKKETARKKILNWVADHLPPERRDQRERLEALAKGEEGRDFELKFVKYDWGPNSSDRDPVSGNTLSWSQRISSFILNLLKP